LADLGWFYFRIIEIEWAVKNKKPFVASPKRAKNRPQKSKSRSKGKQKKDSTFLDADDEMEVDENENDDAYAPSSQGGDSGSSPGTSSGKRKRGPFGQEAVNSPKKRKGKRSTKTKGNSGMGTQSDRDKTEQEQLIVIDDDEWLLPAPPRKLRGRRKLS
jgi:hypothetical protein